MGSKMSALLHFLARALEPGEREAVLGDLAESGASPIRNLIDLVGLILRRQALIWTHWQPWIALLGVAGLSGICLSRMLVILSGQIFQQMHTWQRYGVPYDNGLSFPEILLSMLSLAAAIFCWTAVDVAVLRRMSGRSVWLLWPVFCFVTLEYSSIRSHLNWNGPIEHYRNAIIAVVWFIPSLGALRGQWNLRVMARATIIATCAAALLGLRQSHALEIWSQGAIPGGSWLTPLLPYLLAAWPVVFLLNRPAKAQS